MSDRKLLICPGAAKAGTSWLYGWLHNHPGCHVRSVKELHYFSTFDPDEAGKKLAVFGRQIESFKSQRNQAFLDGLGWKVRNMDRRVSDMKYLCDVLAGDRSNDDAYASYLENGALPNQILADITPGYSVLSREMFQRINRLPFDVRVLFLVRDPLDRLWSHCRMHAERYLREGQSVADKSSNVLKRILNQGIETHIIERSDYRAAIRKIMPVFGDRFCLGYCENLSTDHGQKKIGDFIGLSSHVCEYKSKTHVGLDIPFPEKLRVRTVRYLKDQYDYIADNFGALPQNWAKNRALIS